MREFIIKGELINELRQTVEHEKKRKEKWSESWNDDKQEGYIKALENLIRDL